MQTKICKNNTILNTDEETEIEEGVSTSYHFSFIRYLFIDIILNYL